ncbi:unnamed protein product [Closterium sp. NIES-53]
MGPTDASAAVLPIARPRRPWRAAFFLPAARSGCAVVFCPSRCPAGRAAVFCPAAALSRPCPLPSRPVAASALPCPSCAPWRATGQGTVARPESCGGFVASRGALGACASPSLPLPFVAPSRACARPPPPQVACRGALGGPRAPPPPHVAHRGALRGPLAATLPFRRPRAAPAASCPRAPVGWRMYESSPAPPPPPSPTAAAAAEGGGKGATPESRGAWASKANEAEESRVRRAKESLGEDVGQVGLSNDLADSKKATMDELADKEVA